jgi:regulator of sigma E protease
MDMLFGILIGLLVLMTLVTLHELGHFIAARRNGVRVLEFGIGFPPRGLAWVQNPHSKKWRRLKKAEWDKPQDGLVFSLNLLPIGGFCQMDGETANDKRKGTFGNASFWSKTKILFAGVAMNWLTAFVIFTVLAWTGMPQVINGQFTIKNDETIVGQKHVVVLEVMEDSPAATAGIEKDDRIIAINGEEIYSAESVSAINNQYAGETVTYTIRRKEQISQEACSETPCEEYYDVDKILDVTLNSSDAEYLLGISMSMPQALRRYTWSAPIVGASLTAQLTGETLKSVGDMIGNLVTGAIKQFNPDEAIRTEGQSDLETVADSVSGPVGIVGILFPAFTAAGPTNVAFLAALISVSLACMNVLPIPALDGGRWLLIAIYKLRKKELTKEIEEKIVSRAFVVLLAIAFLVTILDVTRFF